MSDKNGNSDKPGIDELRADIEQTRSELGETVQALAAKADVKARAKEQVEHTKQRVRAQAAEAGEKVRDAATEAGEKVRDVAAEAGGKVRDAAVAAGDKVRAVTGHATDQTAEASPHAGVFVVRERASLPFSLVVAGVAAVVGVILIVRGSRR